MDKNKNTIPAPGLKISGKPSVDIQPNDALETAEMLRATHTLLRMGFGAVAMHFSATVGSDKVKARSLSQSFDKVFKHITDAYEYYVNIYASRNKSEEIS